MARRKHSPVHAVVLLLLCVVHVVVHGGNGQEAGKQGSQEKASVVAHTAGACKSTFREHNISAFFFASFARYTWKVHHSAIINKRITIGIQHMLQTTHVGCRKHQHYQHRHCQE